MTLKRTFATWTSAGTGGLLLACGSCCIPVLAPLVAGVGLGTLGRGWDERLSLWLGGMLVLLAAGVYLYGRRRPASACATAAAPASGACSCGPANGQPLACTLPPGEFMERQAWLDEVRARYLLDASVTGRIATLCYRPEGEAEVRTLAARESACCAFLAFEVRRTADAVCLTITGPAHAEADFSLLVSHLVH